MAWTNAFDLGFCRVEVFQAATPDAPDYSSILVKGQGADLTILSYSLHIAVSSSGVVTLSNIGGGGIESDLGARIVPGYGLTSFTGSRATAPTSCSTSGNATANGSMFDGFTNGDALVDLTAQTPYDRISAQTNSIGSSSITPVVQFTPEFDVPPPPPPIPDCKELGRVTRSFVSGYTASRRETRRIRRFSKRCVVANFNGAMEIGRTITHVRWDCTSPWSLYMSNPRVESTGRTVAIDVSFNFAGWGGLLATATWDNGEITNQEFGFTVLDQPLYPGAVYDNANGPYVLEADA